MIHRIIDASLENRFLVLVALVVLVVVGLWSAASLPVDALPDITNVQVQVLTQAPGLAPVEVEQYVTFPVEAAMSGIPHVEEIRSVTRFGLSAITVVFEEGTDIYWARQMIQERLPAARAAIPQGFGSPEIGPISTGLGEIYQFEVRARPGSPLDRDPQKLMKLRAILDWDIAFQLRKVPGVVEVNTWGGQLKTYEVALDPDALLNYRIPISRVFEALQRNNANAGGGYIIHSGEQRIIRGEGLIESLDDVAHIVLDSREDGTPIYIKDVAQVRFAPMIRQGAVTRDGRGEVPIGIVMMLWGENGRAVVQAVKERIEQIRQSLPEDVLIEPFYDRTDLVDRTIDTVSENISTGAVLVILMLLVLVGDLRAGLIVASAIPLSALVMVAAMRAFGISGNLMSLGAIDFGIIVDGAVVMVENCIRRGSLYLQQHPDKKSVPLEVFRRAGHEVGRPIVFASLIVIIVFLPIFTLRGIEGKMFRPMAFTFSSALIGALVLAVTVMPVAASLFLARRLSPGDTYLVRTVKRGYGPLLRLVMRHPRITFGTALGAFAASVVVALGLGGTFIPELDEGDLAIQAARLPSVSLEQSIRSTTLIEKVLTQFPEVTTVVSKTGRPELATDPMGVELSDLWVMLRRRETINPFLYPLAWLGLMHRPEDRWPTDNNPENLYAVLVKVERAVTGHKELPPAAHKRLRSRAEQIFQAMQQQAIENEKERLVFMMDHLLADYVPGNSFSFSQPIELRFQELIAGVRSDIGISIYGPDLDTLVELGQQIQRVVSRVPGAADVRAQQVAGLPNVRIRIQRSAIARYGINASDVLDAVRCLGGTVVGQVFEGQKRFPLQVRFAFEHRDTLEKLRQLKIADPRGRQIPLDQLAQLSVESGPAMINRESISRRLLVEANVRGRDLAGFVSQAQQAVAREVKLPPGYYITWGGQFKNFQEASRRLAVAVPIALLLIFSLLYLTFGSARLTVLIFLNVPVAATGGILALWLRGMPVSISAGVGFIALFGIAVMNGVVLVEHICELRRTTPVLAEAVYQGAMDRLRPVLMTATTDALGFLPMAISTSAGAEVQRPLATVVIGGVITSSLLTLVVLPAVYRWFEPEVKEVEV